MICERGLSGVGDNKKVKEINLVWGAKALDADQPQNDQKGR
jgi:hypothetical protein